ncbi:hypothetical protein [Rheinheimera baltica]|uniref:hypothetical protein n=1 Tax=Rheinheimera baltica TaxID=67576 RepID=UPI00351804EA
MAVKLIQAYDALKSRWDKEAKQRVQQGRHPLSFAQLHTVDSHAQHTALVHYLASTRQPAFVIAASGMCEGGRVVNFFRHCCRTQRIRWCLWVIGREAP